MSQKSCVRRGRGRSKSTVIDLLETGRIINQHLSESLCEEVFQTTRVAERERVWTLFTLVKFWIHVVLKSPGSLTEALEEGLRGQGKEWPQISGSPQAFFNRSKTLKWTFPAALFQRFVTAVTPKATPSFAAEFDFLKKHFPEIWIVDGSKLDAVGHRLKILWDVRSPVLPGCLTAFYDLFRGYPRILQFDPDAAKAEMNRVREALDQVPTGTLLVGDRLYASVQLFQEISQRGLWGLARLNRSIKLRKLECLSQRHANGGLLEEWWVKAGTGSTAKPQTLRYIRFEKGKDKRELLTDVLEPEKLTAEAALDLYVRRWDVERMFFDLKEVLNLHTFYAANPNGVALQVYAAAMIYVSMKVAQGRAAEQAKVKPEEISPAKFFPRVARVCGTLAGIELGYIRTCQKNPGIPLQPPDPTGMPEVTTPLKEILVKKRTGTRRKRRFCKSRKVWKSFAHIPGGISLIN
jgi:hypothetical protein